MKTKYFDDKQRKLIHSWISQAEESTNEYLKFMSNWIAFNAICYHLFFEEAVKDRVDIDRKKSKLNNVKEAINLSQNIQAETAVVRLKNKRIEIDITLPERLNLSIKEKYTEDLIFEQFVRWYQHKISIEDTLFQSLRDSLKKGDRHYVINMARIKVYKSSSNIDKMAGDGIIVLCEKNDLKTLKNVLYQIRCNIFHGEKIPGDINDDRIVKSANPILKQLNTYLIYEHKITRPENNH